MRNKIIYLLIFIFLIILSATLTGGFAQKDKTKGERWVNHTTTSLSMDDLSATITVKVKNKANRPYYFKIGQAYHGSLAGNNTIKWIIAWTKPQAVKMVKSRFPELGGDYGWRIGPRETKTVTFKLNAVGEFGELPSYIYKAGEESTYYWPLVNEPGLYASWFMPNELDILNPSLQIQSWRGTFTFRLINNDSERVSGIVRAPIVPSNSKLVYSNPKAFIEYDIAPGTYVATWDVTLPAHSSKYFTYIYQWPLKREGGNVTTSRYPTGYPATYGNKTTTIPSKETGTPWGPLIIGVVVTLATLVYTRLIR